MTQTAPSGQPSLLRSAPRISLGLALLLGDRLRSDIDATGHETTGLTAFGLGAASSAAAAAGRSARAVAGVAGGSIRAASSAGRRVWSHPVTFRFTARVRPTGAIVKAEVTNRVNGVAARGRTVATDARADALRFLQSEAASSLGLIRERVLPVVFDELVAEPRVRELVIEQTHGALSDAAKEVRNRSAGADDRLEDGVRKILARSRPEQAHPNPPRPDGGS